MQAPPFLLLDFCCSLSRACRTPPAPLFPNASPGRLRSSNVGHAARRRALVDPLGQPWKFARKAACGTTRSRPG